MPVPELQELQNEANSSAADAPSNSLVRGDRLNLCRRITVSSHAKGSGRICHGGEGGEKRTLPKDELGRAVVAMETVEVATVEPSMGEDAGETLQVECIGAPVHVHVIV